MAVSLFFCVCCNEAHFKKRRLYSRYHDPKIIKLMPANCLLPTKREIVLQFWSVLSCEVVATKIFNRKNYIVAGLERSVKKCASGTFLATGVKASIDPQRILAKRSKSRHPHQEKKRVPMAVSLFFCVCCNEAHFKKRRLYSRYHDPKIIKLMPANCLLPTKREIVLQFWSVLSCEVVATKIFNRKNYIVAGIERSVKKTTRKIGGFF